MNTMWLGCVPQRPFCGLGRVSFAGVEGSTLTVHRAPVVLFGRGGADNGGGGVSAVEHLLFHPQSRWSHVSTSLGSARPVRRISVSLPVPEETPHLLYALNLSQMAVPSSSE